ncbi:MAG: YdcF family protein [Planctomycetes bacterium]|nr:YdcF family protein [Planctomycetota bacterium]
METAGSRHRRRPEGRPSARRLGLRVGAIAAILLLLSFAVAHEHVLRSARPRLYPRTEVPEREAILVLGARVDPGGIVSPMLADRLETALLLYRAGKAPRILLSGDGLGPGADEVAAMSAFLLARGVPAEALLEDREGLRTIDTMARARRIFGLSGAIVVSNPFHVARAVFLAQHAGLDAVGVGAEPGVSYSFSTLFRNRGREIAARVRAVLDVYVLRDPVLEAL